MVLNEPSADINWSLWGNAAFPNFVLLDLMGEVEVFGAAVIHCISFFNVDIHHSLSRLLVCLCTCTPVIYSCLPQLRENPQFIPPLQPVLNLPNSLSHIMTRWTSANEKPVPENLCPCFKEENCRGMRKRLLMNWIQTYDMSLISVILAVK